MTTRTHIRRIVTLGIVAATASGCGGGGDVPVDPAAGAAAPVPGETTPGAVAGGDGTVPAATDPLTGQPVDPAAAGGAGGGVTATIPDLVGGDTGGLGASAGPVFVAKATDKPVVDAKDTDAESSDGSKGAGGDLSSKQDESSPTETKEAPTFAAAKIYVDGIVHEVAKGGSFPKGNPVFKLLNVTGTTIEVELIAGEFTTGGGTGTVLDKGDLVSLVNASEQLTYRIKYLRGVTGAAGITL